MIIEDYCSFELAKLLKEKGFDAELKMYWSVGLYNDPILHCCPQYFEEDEEDRIIEINNSGKECTNSDNPWKPKEFECIAPTLQMAMKWLREVYNIHIELNPICYGDTEEDIEWHYGWAVKTTIFIDRWKRHNAEHISYEQACEAAIKYCLENLI